jgi:leucyl-tRNA synthetase
MARYPHRHIEAKWQKFWEENRAFRSEEEPGKPKYYVLDMFPYPSGAGLHVGHVLGYTATDIVARYKRQKGFSVLHPMGWDAFGLPAEQYAIRTGTHPAVTTRENIANYKRQLKALGFSYDWEREFSTTDPAYYKWTQWIFTKLYEKGLAYEAELLVNYCPALGTVVANEEVENGVTREGGYVVERRPLRQWVLKITAYADRLLNDLETLDWPESIKKHQINWIGRREGASVRFSLPGGAVDVFTRRVDTLFGVTYLVLAPEHPLVAQITTAEQRQAVEDYQTVTARKSDFDRTEVIKEKTGAFTGAYGVHPVTGEKVPVWIADYVLMSYGTGAVMAVPAHDERDFDFAKFYNLPIRAVVLPADAESAEAIIAGELCWPGEGTLVNSAHGDCILNGLDVEAAKIEMVHWLERHARGKKMVNYRLRDWLFSRQRFWGEPIPILHFPDGTTRALEVDELPLLPPPVPDYRPTNEGYSPLANVRDWVHTDDSKTGREAKRETNTMPQWAGSCWYYLRFCDPHNEQALCAPAKQWYWMPVDLYVGGAEHAVLHLLYARFWHKVLHDCGVVSQPEPFKKLFNQGLITAQAFRRQQGGYVAPVEVEQRAEGYFHRETGEQLESHIEKMSKSKLNVVTPDEIIEEFGADALRLYEMFMGPLEKEKPWSTEGVTGCYRFLCRIYELATSDRLSDQVTIPNLQLTHKTVHFVETALENLHFNTAIAKMMEFLNSFADLEQPSKEAFKMVIQALAPFAPHAAEEVWESLGEKSSIFDVAWPQVDPQYLVDATCTYVIQVDGKLRGRFELPKDASESAVIAAAKANPRIASYLARDVLKVVVVPNRLVNFVTAL